jgi:hypothetical protein
MDFGQLDPAAENVLALTGWLRYGSAGVNIALSQNDRLSVIPPTLEAQTADGSWSHIHVTVGMPAGKTKTILTDLTGKLPPDTQKLRLTSTFEIRWDRIALGRRAPLEPANVHTLTPDSADLHWIGFPEMSANGPDLPITPDHDRRSDQPKWRRTPQGWCTRYGPVLELIAESDEKIAILNGGDAATITFDANALPPVPENYKRTFFFLCVGWEKDGDHNVIHGDTIHPLPIETTESEENPLENWQLRYNTRFTPGAMFDDRQ